MTEKVLISIDDAFNKVTGNIFEIIFQPRLYHLEQFGVDGDAITPEIKFGRRLEDEIFKDTA